MQVLSNASGVEEKVCVDCFCKEPRQKKEAPKSKVQMDQDIRQAMDALDETMREIDSLYPDLKPKKYVLRNKAFIRMS